jgi:hypothetical protein
MVLGSNAIFQPLGAELESSTSSAGAVPVLRDHDRERRLLAGLGAAGEHAVAAREHQLRLTGDFQRKRRLGGGVFGRRPGRDG